MQAVRSETLSNDADRSVLSLSDMSLLILAGGYFASGSGDIALVGTKGERGWWVTK